jgi:tetratricopeptide (TPR) repeat protein
LGHSVTFGWNSLSDKVSQSVEARPRVIPAADPPRLSSMPQQLSPVVYVQAARYSEQQGRLDAARQQYEKALELAPEDTGTLLEFARFYDRQQQTAAAVDLYQQAERTAPNNATLLNDWGLCLARAGQIQPALDRFQRAVALQPSNIHYRNNLANVLIADGRQADALETLRAVHPLAIAHYNLGYLLSQQNKPEEAALHLQEAMQLDPSLAPAREMLARVRASTRSAALPPPSSSASTFPFATASSRPHHEVWESAPLTRQAPQGSLVTVVPADVSAGTQSAARPHALPTVR